MSTSVSVMEGDVKKKWYVLPIWLVSIISFLPLNRDSLFMKLEKLADKEFDSRDVPPDLQDRAVLLRESKIKGVHGSRTNMLLSDYTCVHVGLVEEQR